MRSFEAALAAVDDEIDAMPAEALTSAVEAAAAGPSAAADSHVRAAASMAGLMSVVRFQASAVVSC